MDFSHVTTPETASLLIGFMDIQGFAELVRTLKDPLALFQLINGWACLITERVEASGGRVIKFIGDECMVCFPGEAADTGVRALLSAKAEAEAYLAQAGVPARMRATVHFGDVVVGMLGAGSCRNLDVYGDSVNVAATLGRGEHRGRLVISPQAFRKLSPATRKSFHKYTPPVVYVAE